MRPPCPCDRDAAGDSSSMSVSMARASEAVLNENDSYPPRADVAIWDGVRPTKRLSDLVRWG